MEDTRFQTDCLEEVVKKCASGPSAGCLVSTAQAVEELRVLTGDFVTEDETLANSLSTTALGMGCSVVLDERAGADTLRNVTQ